MIEKDGILLLDGQTKYNIDHNPNKTREIVNGFSIHNFGDDVLKGLKLKLDAQEPIDLFKYRNDKAVYLVNSKIYNNVYYTIESFNTNYKKDFRNLIIRIARKMGAKLITVVFSDEEDYNSSNKYNVDAGVNIADLPINLETNIKGDSSEYKNVKRHSKYTIIDNDAEGVSKEDFQKFLHENFFFDYDNVQLIPNEAHKVLFVKIGTVERAIYNWGDGIQQLIVILFFLCFFLA